MLPLVKTKMCDSASSDEETNGQETLSTVLVSSSPNPPSVASKRPLDEATTASGTDPPPRRVRRKASDFGHVGGQFTAADPDEDDGPTARAPQDAPPAPSSVVVAIPPEVVVVPETRCSFGSEMVARPMDPSNIRELVNAREEQVEAATLEPEAGQPNQAALGNDGNAGARGATHCAPPGSGELAASSADGSVETAAVGGGGRVIRGFRYEGNEVDPLVADVPMLLMGQKRTSKDKFYNLHEAMRRENMTFLVATMKDEDGGLIYPLKCNLHEVVFNKQDALRDLIHEKWFGDPSSIVAFAKSCFQVSQTRPDGSGTNVCLYLRVDAEVVAGLEGEAAACARFGELKNGAGCGDAGLVIALDDITAKKINQCSEAASFLHPDVVASVSAPTRRKKSAADAPPPATKYVRLDDFPLSGDKEEHPSFKFRLKSSKTPSKESKRKQATLRVGSQAVLVSSGGDGGGEAEVETTGVASDNTTPSGGAHALQQTLFASMPSVPARAPDPAPTLSEPTPPPDPPPTARTEATAPSSALVVRSSEDEKMQNATEDEKATWLDAGSALGAIGVQRPTLPRFPTMVMLKVDPKKISMQPWGDGEVVLLIQP